MKIGLVVAFGFLLFVEGCDMGEQQTQTFEPAPSTSAGDGSNLRFVMIEADRDAQVTAQEVVVKKQLSEMVNSGKYDIVKIQTVYVGGFLVVAEVYYRK